MTFTDEQIKDLARQHYPAHTSPMAESYHLGCLRAFAEAVAAQQREECAEIAENWTPDSWITDGEEKREI
jgi:hypothetical protein